MATQQLNGGMTLLDKATAAAVESLPVIDDAFIQSWPNGGQAQLTPLFLALQQQHIAQLSQPALPPSPSAFTSLLHSLLSSVLPPSPAVWVGTVASFLWEVLDRSAHSSTSAAGSISQTAVVDDLWLVCQSLNHTAARLAARDERSIGAACAELPELITAVCVGVCLYSGSLQDETNAAARERIAQLGKALIVTAQHIIHAAAFNLLLPPPHVYTAI